MAASLVAFRGRLAQFGLADVVKGAGMGYVVVDVEEIPTTWGTFKFVRHHLGATAFGLSQIDFPPDKVGFEHDDNQIHQVLATVTTGGESGMPLRPRFT